MLAPEPTVIAETLALALALSAPDAKPGAGPSTNAARARSGLLPRKEPKPPPAPQARRAVLQPGPAPTSLGEPEQAVEPVPEVAELAPDVTATSEESKAPPVQAPVMVAMDVPGPDPAVERAGEPTVVTAPVEVVAPEDAREPAGSAEVIMVRAPELLEEPPIVIRIGEPETQR